MPGISPVAGFHDYRAQQADLNDFANYAVDFHPVAHSNSIAAHQDKPSKEADNKIFERYSEPRARQAQNRGRLIGGSEDDERNQQNGEGLQSKSQNRAQRAEMLLLRLTSG